MNCEVNLPFYGEQPAACGRASGQVLNQTKDGNDDFLLRVGMRLGSHGADCSMGTCVRCLGATLRGGRARNSPC